MTPPTHDREQALLLELRELRAQVAELEDELYGPESIRTGQVGHLNEALRIQAERADRAEELAAKRLDEYRGLDKSLTKALEKIEWLVPRCNRAEERLRTSVSALQKIADAGFDKTWASQVAREALRAVLPVEQEH